MSSAFAEAISLTSAWPSAVLPSETRTLRCFGSQVNSRNCRSSAISEPSLSGSAAITACPARSSAARTRTRCVTDSWRCATTIGPQSSLTRPSRHGRRSRKKRSLLWWSTVCARSSPPSGCGFQSSRIDKHFWHASRGGYCTAPQSRHCCSSKRPIAAAAVRPSAMRLRAAGGSVGRRVRRTGFLRLGRSKNCCSGAESTIEVDHSKAANEAEFRILDGPGTGLAGELADRFDHAEEAARSAGLPDRELAAVGVERKGAVVGEGVLADERGALALAAEAEILDLHERDHRVVVVGLDEVHVRRP